MSLANEVDLSNVDLTGVDTAMPILEPGIVSLKVKKIEKVENKAKTGHNLNFEFTLERPHKSVRGDDINVGFTVFDTCSLVKTEKYDPSRRLAEFQEAVLGKKEVGFHIDSYVGRELTARVKVETDAEYGDRTRIARYVKKDNAS